MCSIIFFEDRDVQQVAEVRALCEEYGVDFDAIFDPSDDWPVPADDECLCSVPCEDILQACGFRTEWDPFGVKVTGRLSDPLPRGDG